MTTNEHNNTPAPKKMGKTTLRRRKHVAEQRATAQRTKLDAQAQARAHQAAEKAAEAATSKPKGRHDQQRLQASRRARLPTPAPSIQRSRSGAWPAQRPCCSQEVPGGRLRSTSERSLLCAST